MAGFLSFLLRSQFWPTLKRSTSHPPLRQRPVRQATFPDKPLTSLELLILGLKNHKSPPFKILYQKYSAELWWNFREKNQWRNYPLYDSPYFCLFYLPLGAKKSPKLTTQASCCTAATWTSRGSGGSSSRPRHLGVDSAWRALADAPWRLQRKFVA